SLAVVQGAGEPPFGLWVGWKFVQRHSSRPVLFMRRSYHSQFAGPVRSEEHTSELQSLTNLVCRLLLEKKKKTRTLFIFSTFSSPCPTRLLLVHLFFFFMDPAPTALSTLSLHDALPIFTCRGARRRRAAIWAMGRLEVCPAPQFPAGAVHAPILP